MPESMSLRRRVRFVLELGYALTSLARIELGLRRHDLPTLCRKLGIAWDLQSAEPPGRERAILPRNTRTAVLASCHVVARWPAGDSCLRRCLVLGHRLRRLTPVLRIGVRRDEAGAFLAHSWLEIGGGALDPAAADYLPLGATGDRT
jgi:hypothetical protein